MFESNWKYVTTMIYLLMVSLTILNLAMVDFAINIATILILATITSFIFYLAIINLCIIGLPIKYLFIG